MFFIASSTSSGLVKLCSLTKFLRKFGHKNTPPCNYWLYILSRLLTKKNTYIRFTQNISQTFFENLNTILRFAKENICKIDILSVFFFEYYHYIGI